MKIKTNHRIGVALFSLAAASAVACRAAAETAPPPADRQRNTPQAAAPRFAPLVLPQESRPSWWRVRPAEIIEICRNVRRGRAEIIAHTPHGYPVYAVFYGDFSEAPPRSNWSAASASGNARSFAPEAVPQTVLFCAGIHGAEAESTAALTNLIQLLETGRDFRGRSDPELTELLRHYRLILVPCVNMDARAISPDHLRLSSRAEFDLASQGRWSDGTPIGWLDSKEFFPLPLDRVSFPGGYPNGDGVNIMHDCCAGNLRSAEAAALIRLCERQRVDCVINGHSYSYAPSVLPPSGLNYPANYQRAAELAAEANTAFARAGLRTAPAPQAEPPQYLLNLNTQMTLASGALTLTLECNVSSQYHGKQACLQSFEQMVEPNYLLLKILLRSGLKKPLLDRKRLILPPSSSGS